MATAPSRSRGASRHATRRKPAAAGPASRSARRRGATSCQRPARRPPHRRARDRCWSSLGVLAALGDLLRPRRARRPRHRRGRGRRARRRAGSSSRSRCSSPRRGVARPARRATTTRTKSRERGLRARARARRSVVRGDRRPAAPRPRQPGAAIARTAASTPAVCSAPLVGAPLRAGLGGVGAVIVLVAVGAARRAARRRHRPAPGRGHGVALGGAVRRPRTASALFDAAAERAPTTSRRPRRRADAPAAARTTRSADELDAAVADSDDELDEDEDEDEDEEKKTRTRKKKTSTTTTTRTTSTKTKTKRTTKRTRTKKTTTTKRRRRRATRDRPPPGTGQPWKLPPANVLKRSESQRGRPALVEQGGEVLEATLREFGVDARLIGTTVGPTVTRYELELAPGVKVNRVTSLAKEIAYAMASHDVRILAPIPGRSAIGVEVPNKMRPLVTLGDILASAEAKKATHPLEVGLGRDIAGRAVMLEPRDVPARAHRRPDRRGQVELHQQHRHVAAHAHHARPGAPDPRRPEARRARPVQRPAAPAHRGRHQPEEGGERARLGRARDGDALRRCSPRSACATSPATTRCTTAASCPTRRRPRSRHAARLRAAAVHRRRRRRAQRPHDGRGARRRDEHLPHRADGPRRRHPPRDRDAAPVGRRHHRRDQGQHPEPARVLGEHASPTPA